MSFDNGRLIGGDDMSLSILNPFNAQVVQLDLNHFVNFNGLGYRREPIRETVGRTSYSPFGEPITPGVPNFSQRVKHRFFFDCNLSDDDVTKLWAIWNASETNRGNPAAEHRILLRDTRQLYLQLGNTNDRSLASGSVDITNIPGTAQYFSDFLVTFEEFQGVFNLASAFSGTASSVWTGVGQNFSGEIAPSWRMAWTMVEEDLVPS